jgi:hypothetical protein
VPVTRALRLVIVVVGALTVTLFLLQAVVVRPRLYPAGAGLALSGDGLFGPLSEPSAISFARLPELAGSHGPAVIVRRVWPGGAADRAGVAPGTRIAAIEDATGRRVDFGQGLPATADGSLILWRQMQQLATEGPLTLDVAEADRPAPPRRVVLERPAVWSLDIDTMVAWLVEYHAGPLAKLLTYTLAALLIVALGIQGTTAGLLAVAFLLMGAADAGPLLGGERHLGLLAPLLIGFNWLALPVAFPVIGLAVLHFPSRAARLDHHPWIVPAVLALAIPLAVIHLEAAVFLQGFDGVLSSLAWVASRPWVTSAWFTIGLACNVVIIADGVRRYRTNPDAAARRRIQVVVLTGVPGTMAYALSTGAPILARVGGWDFRWPWPIGIALYFVMVLSALGLAYSVAVRRALSPRIVLRQGLQYALARKTLAALTMLPVVLLVASFVRQSDRPLSEIVRGRPGFYLTSIALVLAGFRYRERWQRWLDRRFFRVEYDARELLLSLANRVPNESDPSNLVALVLKDVDSALHPESAAILAERNGSFEPIQSIGPAPPRIATDSALAQLLRWSAAPLDVVLEDDGSPAGRLPASDRAWLRETGASLVLPVNAAAAPERPLIGLMVLGRKRSDEPFSPEDRRLLAGIASQMGLALDLSRLRSRDSSTPAASRDRSTATPTTFGLRGVEVGATIDGKYRVDALIGQGGMGAVFRARDLGLDRDVAVKVVRPDFTASPQARERFRREARLAARLQHPAIVSVYDYGTTADGSAYLVMEFVRGTDLRARLADGPLDASEALRVLSAVADAVDAAHREQVIHRDLKPENVLLPEHGGPKVVDFGVATLMTRGPDGTPAAGGTIVGTPGYMAPEQLRGEPVDARTDVYSLAVMGHEMLTGRLPFGERDDDRASGRRPAATAPLPPRLAAVLQRGLSFERDQRPRTARALTDGLAEALAPRPDAKT